MTEIKATYNAIVDKQQELDDYQAESRSHIEALKASIEQSVIDAISNCKPDEVLLLASEIYWLGIEHTGFATYAKETWKKIFGYPLQPIPFTTDFKCGDCGKPIQVESLAALNFLTEHKRYGYICEQCKSANEQKSREQCTIQNAQLEARLQELRSMPYTEYLQTPEWNATRKAALKQAKYRCQLCNASGELNVHHRSYERLGCELASDVIVLCANCHAKHHDKGA